MFWSQFKNVMFVCFFIVLLCFFSCGGAALDSSSTTTSSSTDSIYPHSSSWSSTGSHGDTASDDITVCQECHGSDLTGGTSEVSCDECHGMPSFVVTTTYLGLGDEYYEEME